MTRPSFVSVQLARFDAIRPAGDADTTGLDDLLFGGVGADCRASGADPASREAFVFLLLGLHATEAGARAFVAARPSVAPWWDGARETWASVLQPFRHHGTANHLDRAAPGPLFDAPAEAVAPPGPMVSITSAGWDLGPALDMERVRTFSLGVGAVRAGMTSVPGLHAQQSFFFPGVIEFDPVTVTLWRDFDAMRQFAYGPGTHRLQLDRHRRAPNADRSSFTRCRVVESAGTWYGRRPEAWGH